MRLALWESRLIWPAIARPDFVLSLGTGTDLNSQPDAPHFRHVWGDGFIPRTLRWLKGVIDGEDEWRNLVNDIDRDHRGSFMRMNISLPPSANTIDDANHVETLGKEVFEQSQRTNDDRQIGINLLLSRLYFELDELPKFTGHGLYHCRGTIRSRISGQTLAQAAKAISIENAAYFFGKELLTVTNFQDDTCRFCHLYTKKINFYVRHLDQPVQISIGRDTEHNKIRDLSVFPQSMRWFIIQQGLEAPFGSSDNGMPNRQRCKLCNLTFKHQKRRNCSDNSPRKRKQMKYFLTISE